MSRPPSSSEDRAAAPRGLLKLTAAELEAVRAAAAAAESRSGGELVCVLVDRCDAYEGAVWKAAALGAIAGAVATTVAEAAAAGWGAAYLPYLPLLAAGVGAALGAGLVALLPVVRRALVPPDVLARRVERRAAQAFLDEEVFATRDRTGVLLFVAGFERRVRIVADRGIERRVPAATWDRIAGELARGIRAGEAGRALVAAVEACGEVLADHRVERRPDDVNELPDAPRVSRD